jgi:hypothetical protein
LTKKPSIWGDDHLGLLLQCLAGISKDPGPTGYILKGQGYRKGHLWQLQNFFGFEIYDPKIE